MEWKTTALACLKINCTVVSLYTNLGKEGVAYGIKHVQPKLIVTTQEVLPNLITILTESGTTSYTQNIVYFEHPVAQKENPETKFDFKITSLR